MLQPINHRQVSTNFVFLVLVALLQLIALTHFWSFQHLSSLQKHPSQRKRTINQLIIPRKENHPSLNSQKRQVSFTIYGIMNIHVGTTSNHAISLLLLLPMFYFDTSDPPLLLSHLVHASTTQSLHTCLWMTTHIFQRATLRKRHPGLPSAARLVVAVATSVKATK